MKKQDSSFKAYENYTKLGGSLSFAHWSMAQTIYRF
jgi:hypothetical protein